MDSAGDASIEWVVLTRGDRPEPLQRALASAAATTCVVLNGAPPDDAPDRTGADRTIVFADNLGVPAGRDAAARTSSAEIVGFLDDDAVLGPGATAAVLAAFAADERLGVVTLRLVDEQGDTARRHVPRRGKVGVARSGEVVAFLGGACAIRRAAYLDAGGYFTDLFYGHEELELAWRLIDRGWKVRYLADVETFHPRTEISRHADGWWFTGRNRVWIARRTLPWPIAFVHTAVWFALGLRRAPDGACRAQYRRGWIAGWRTSWASPVARRPIRWTTVLRLARLGRPPIV